jgi:hypothetical protein
LPLFQKYHVNRSKIPNQDILHINVGSIIKSNKSKLDLKKEMNNAQNPTTIDNPRLKRKNSFLSSISGVNHKNSG